MVTVNLGMVMVVFGYNNDVNILALSSSNKISNAVQH